MKRPRSRLRILAWLLATAVAVEIGLVVFLWLYVPSPPRQFLPFPPDKDCAIAITDDTDGFQFATTRPVYDLLDSLGMRVTKTIWVYDAPGHPPGKVGLSLADPSYRRWVQGEIGRGHEITLHSPSSGDDPRARILAAQDTLRRLIGHQARLEIFHSNNKEAFYWGAQRLPNPLLRAAYRLLSRTRFEGNDPASSYYWSDLSRGLVRYVRNYSFNGINTLRLNPSMPYFDPRTPEAPLWFGNSNGRTGKEFSRLLSPPNVEALKEQRGASIVYTHFGAGFSVPDLLRGRAIAPEIHATLVRIGTDPAVECLPAGELLDRLRVIQIVEAALAARSNAVTIPAELAYAIDGISAPEDRSGERTGTDPVAGRSGMRIGLRAWLEAHEVHCETGGDVFANSVRIGWAERWRLVLRWLSTQLVSKT